MQNIISSKQKWILKITRLRMSIIDGELFYVAQREHNNHKAIRVKTELKYWRTNAKHFLLN